MPEEVDKQVEAATGIPEVADRRVAADKPAEEVETAEGEEPLPRLRGYRRIRKNGCSPQYCGHNWCKNAETFFTSLAGIIRVL